MLSVHGAFRDAVRDARDRPFLCVVGGDPRRIEEVSYGQVDARVEGLRRSYADAGYAAGNKVALLLGRVPFVCHFLALNALGCVCVPLNPDLHPDEMLYQVDHSGASVIVTDATHVERMRQVAGRSANGCRAVAVDGLSVDAALPAPGAAHGLEGLCSILYTSGTTGRPKGCMLTNETHLAAGERYRDMGGLLQIFEGRDRFYNPTPFHHTNILVVNLTCAILTRNCLVMPERFSATHWWADIAATRSTAVHYVGIIPTVLMKLAPVPAEREHRVRFGFGGGAEPTLHEAFERRFGFPLVEIWGMTETTRVFGDNHEPRMVGTRAFGRPDESYQARIVDDGDRELPRGTPGELVVRSGGVDPRRYFFAGYYKDEAATEAAWRNGWFHTGDMVSQDADGMLHFVDRKKNMIRRSGENISAAEVEAVLISHPAVANVAVIAAPDEVREQEVMACVILRPEYQPTEDAARQLAGFALQRIAYYKAPGWVVFVPDLPLTASQRLQRARIFPAGTDPRRLPEAFDLRGLKKRPPTVSPEREAR